MILSEINSKITQLTGADTSTSGYATANRLVDINLWQHKILTMILNSQDESDFDDQRNTTYPFKYLSLAAGLRDYSIPVSEKVVAIKRVDITYDGTNWYKAEPLDSGEILGGIPLSTETEAELALDNNFAKSSPRYDSKANAIFIYPRATQAEVDAGAQMKVEWVREITEFTSAELSTGTVVPGFDSAFHPILAYGPAFEYCQSLNLPQTKTLFAMLQDYEGRLRKTYGEKQKDRSYQLSGQYQSYK